MPYFISQDTDCPEWAVVKDDDMVIACHPDKESAIAQMVAISIEENIEPGGERYLKKKKMKKPNYRAPVDSADNQKRDEVQSPGGGLPNHYRPATSPDVPDGRACGNCFYFNEKDVAPDGRARCMQWGEYVSGGFVCNAWKSRDADEARQESEPAPKKEQIVGSDTNKPGSAQGAGGDIKLGEATETALRNKAKEHNEEMKAEGNPDYTRTTFGQLAAVFRRGAGAYSTSHRPGMTRNQWAMARVNAYLYLLEYGEPQNKAYITDNDLLPEGHPKSTRSRSEDRAINQDAPAYMRAAARRGLEFHAEGLSGDGVTDQTLREARLMVNGEVSDDKWIRLSAWIARHLVDLDSPDSDPDSDDYPSPGVVAHLLWGSGPTKRAAQRTKEYADSVVARIRAEETMETNNKWLDVARAIALKIDGQVSKEPEVRVNNTQIELRDDTADGMTFTGYASVFNSPSEDLGGFIEYVAPGAFKRSLQSRNEIKLLWNHDTGEPLASLRGGTMQLVEDTQGLKVTATLPNTNRGRDVAELLRTKVIDSMSFGFNVIRDAWSKDGKTRTLESVRLSEVSIVSFAAYNSTTATVRSAPTINPDELAYALLRLESGEDLDEAQATLLTDVVSRLKVQPEVEEAIDTGLDLLDIKKKQLDLLLKRI